METFWPLPLKYFFYLLIFLLLESGGIYFRLFDIAPQVLNVLVFSNSFWSRPSPPGLSPPPAPLSLPFPSWLFLFGCLSCNFLLCGSSPEGHLGASLTSAKAARAADPGSPGGVIWGPAGTEGSGEQRSNTGAAQRGAGRTGRGQQEGEDRRGKQERRREENRSVCLFATSHSKVLARGHQAFTRASFKHLQYSLQNQSL